MGSRSKSKSARRTQSSRRTSTPTRPSTKVMAGATLPTPEKPWSWYEADAPLISMAMMVKNEEDFLKDALLSAKDLVDEMIVVDTGSSDNTVQIAKDLGAQVFHYRWQDDFSDARNETIRRCNGQWVLILDADERVRIDRGKIAGFRHSLRKFIAEGPYVGVSIQVINIRLDGSLMNSLPSLRFFPRCEEISYRNRVHNQIALADEKVEMQLKLCDFVTIEHLGYDPVIYERRKKSARSLPLIQKMIEDEPENMVYRFYEGREFVILKQPEKAVESLETAVLGILEGKSGYFAETMKTLFTAYEQVNAVPERIHTFAEMAIGQNPEQPDFYLFKGLAEYNLKRFEEAAVSLKEALDKWENFVLVEVSQSNPIIEQRVWLVDQTLADVYWKLERYSDAYHHYLRCIQDLPEAIPDWPKILNNTIALAIEYDDEKQLTRLFQYLLTRADTIFEMYFYRIKQLCALGRQEEAVKLFTWGNATTSRLKRSPEYAEVSSLLGVE